MAGYQFGYTYVLYPFTIKSVWLSTTQTSHRKVTGHKYQSLCFQMDHGLPHLEVCVWMVVHHSTAYLSLLVHPMQGSVIGPLLFIFYINGITSISLSDGTFHFFANDCMLLYHPIRSPVDYQHLQIDINCLCDWTDLNYQTTTTFLPIFLNSAAHPADQLAATWPQLTE